MKITVVGAGNMGGALVKAWAGFSDLKVCATARSQKTLDSFSDYNVVTMLDNRAAVADADIIVLAVKPWLVSDVINEIYPYINPGRQIVVSVAANVSIDSLKSMLNCEGGDIFYAMPNIAAEFHESMTFVAADAQASEASVSAVRSLFERIGSCMLCDEKMVKPGMMMAGCGIAYVMRFLRAMMEAGVEMGFYPDQAKDIALQTMAGAVELLTQTGLHPEAAIDKVTTPGGVTIKGLNELDHAGFNSAVIRCLKAGLKD